MQCPICKNMLVRQEYCEVEVNACPQCRGMFVSAEQFNALVKAAGQEPAAEAERFTFKPRDVVRPLDGDVAPRTCPECGGEMREFNYAYDSNVFLDRCMQCRGLWLDADEITGVARHIKPDPRIAAAAKGLIHRGPNLKSGFNHQPRAFAPRSFADFLMRIVFKY